MSNSIDNQYLNLVKDILENGVKKQDRTGTGTLSVFGRQIKHRMQEGFPLLTTKKMAYRSVFTELIWFVMGGTNIKFLLDNDCYIWVGDAYKNYLNDHALDADYYTKEEFVNKIKTDEEFCKKWGELGPIYGWSWRNWNGEIDQIAKLMEDLRENPDSRRLMVTAWNPSDLDKAVLPPCHYGFQVYTRELSQSERFNWYGNKIGSHMHHDHIEQEMNARNVPTRAISLMWNQRSVDVPLGLPFNIASYGALLMMLADEMQMVPDELIANLGDCHIYLNQVDGCKEQLGREPYKLPTLRIQDGMYSRHVEDFILEGYVSHPSIKFPLSN